MMQQNQADRKMLSALCDALKAETDQPCRKRDYDKIARLSAAIAEATVPAERLAAQEQRGLAAVAAAAAAKRRALPRLCKPAAVLLSAGLLCALAFGSRAPQESGQGFFRTGAVSCAALPGETGFPFSYGSLGAPDGIPVRCDIEQSVRKTVYGAAQLDSGHPTGSVPMQPCWFEISGDSVCYAVYALEEPAADGSGREQEEST